MGKYPGELPWRKANGPVKVPLAPGETVLPAGSLHSEGGRPLPCDILLERDQAVTLRDGTTIYVDIYRPVGANDIPAILCWSPYGKIGTASTHTLDQFPYRAGVPEKMVSGLQCFESADPAFWCAQDYAVILADSRGAVNSEGDILHWGPDEALDGADTIEWIAARDWCSGKVGMCGNSWLAICQWFIAAERPPHLAAIAPWEGMNDLFRDHMVIGGIPKAGFKHEILSRLAGNGSVEFPPDHLVDNPVIDEYLGSKIARIEQIEVPAYVVASWTHFLHTRGTLRAWERLTSEHRWLRVHDNHEWPDLYSNEYELLRFFDRYLKGIENGWEKTAQVRLSILDPGHHNIIARPEPGFPVPDIAHHPFYLDARSRHLLPELPSRDSSVAYSPASEGTVPFAMKFHQTTDLIGWPELRLWVSAPEADDIDVFVLLQKISARGDLLRSLTYPLPHLAEPVLNFAANLGLRNKHIQGTLWDGAQGCLRASHRRLDESRSAPGRPYHPHDTLAPVERGTPVELAIEIWALGMRWHKGESLRITVSGHDFHPYPRSDFPASVNNHGPTVIHTGPSYPSRILLPLRLA